MRRRADARTGAVRPTKHPPCSRWSTARRADPPSPGSTRAHHPAGRGGHPPQLRPARQRVHLQAGRLRPFRGGHPPGRQLLHQHREPAAHLRAISAKPCKKGDAPASNPGRVRRGGGTDLDGSEPTDPFGQSRRVNLRTIVGRGHRGIPGHHRPHLRSSRCGPRDTRHGGLAVRGAR